MNRKFLTLRRMLLCTLTVAIALSCSGCMSGNTNDGGKVPQIPSKLSKNDDGVPMLKVYNTDEKKIEEMDIETYVMGVVAGEMNNEWPMEALKAQAILARTFTMKFVSDKSSSYEGADISTDVREAQAYNADAINDRVREAVNETRGLVMIADGEFPYAWFHAHAGGKTELPSKALEYSRDPEYLSVVDSDESEDAPDEVKHWTATFTLGQARRACEDAGVDVGAITSFKIGEKGASGRAVSFLVNGKKVSAPSFRLQIDASKLKSTLIDNIKIEGDKITFSGSGFGHGVGMSQWGAYKMAGNGRNAEDIIKHYYTGVSLSELW